LIPLVCSPLSLPSLSPIPGPQFSSQTRQFQFSLPPLHSFPRDLTQASRSEEGSDFHAWAMNWDASATTLDALIRSQRRR
jgi:hypothetical protein